MLHDMASLWRKMFPDGKLSYAKHENGDLFMYGTCPLCGGTDSMKIEENSIYLYCNNCGARADMELVLTKLFGFTSDFKICYVLEKEHPLNDFDYYKYAQIIHPHIFRKNQDDTVVSLILPEDREPVKPCNRCGYEHFIYHITKSNVKPYCLFCGQHQPVPRKIKNVGKTNQNLRTGKGSTSWAWKVKNRYEGKCALCGSTDHCEAHHIIPWSVDEEQRYSVNNGIYLCKKHHALAHKKPNVFNPRNKENK